MAMDRARRETRPVIRLNTFTAAATPTAPARIANRDRIRFRLSISDLARSNSVRTVNSSSPYFRAKKASALWATPTRSASAETANCNSSAPPMNAMAAAPPPTAAPAAPMRIFVRVGTKTTSSKEKGKPSEPYP